MIAEVIESGGVKSLRPLSGNSVAAAERFPDYAHPKTISSNTWIADEDVYIVHIHMSNQNYPLKIDGTTVGVADSMSDHHTAIFCGYARKGQTIFAEDLTISARTKIFPLLPVSSSSVPVDDEYSTSETMTNKTWIDGKRIYRKVYPVSSGVTLYEEHWLDSSYGVPATDINSWSKIISSTYISSNIGIFPVNLWLQSGHIFTNVLCSNRQISSASGDVIVMEYTKA